MSEKAKKVSESVTVMTEMVMPNDTNPLGNLMGGNLMRWMDIVASICEYLARKLIPMFSNQLPLLLSDRQTVALTQPLDTSHRPIS